MPGSIRAAAILAAALCLGPAAAQDDDERDGGREDAPFDRTPQSCITASRIDRTEIIDDSTIIFHMRGREQAYVNALPRTCLNLAREGRFTYQRRTSQLCDDATITVLEFGGAGFGLTCQLGQFHPVTEAQIEELRLAAEQSGSPEALDVEEVELPDGEDDDG